MRVRSHHHVDVFNVVGSDLVSIQRLNAWGVLRIFRCVYIISFAGLSTTNFAAARGRERGEVRAPSKKPLST